MSEDLDKMLETDADYNTRLSNEELKRQAQKEEPRFLSILIRDQDCLMDAMAFGIKPGARGHFWDVEARQMYNIIFEYYRKYHKILTRTAVDSVMDTIDKVGKVKIDDEHRAKIRMYWDKIHSMEAPIEDYELLKENINNRYVQWQAYELLKEELEKIVRTKNNQREMVKEARERFFKIDCMEMDNYTLSMGLGEGMEKVKSHITNRRDNPEESPSVMTGIDAIDKIFNGWAVGSYTIITGMVNGGKTTLMFNIAFNMARAGYGVVYVSLEKEAVPLWTRLLALHALVDYNRIKTGGKGEKGLSDYYYNKLMEAADDLEKNIKPNFECLQAAQGTKLSKILADIDRIKARMKVDVIVVDYLGVIGFETSHPTRPDLDEALVSQRLQAYGRVNKFVTITASQLKTPSSKDIRGKAKKATAEDASKVEVNTEDLAGSKMIIADADNALGCILNADNPPTKMFVHVTKARDDVSRVTRVLDFDGKLGRVSDPILEPGRVSAVDAIVYDSATDVEELSSNDGLFAENPEDKKVKVENIEKVTPVKPAKEKDLFEDEENNLDDTSDVTESDIDNLEESAKKAPDSIKKDGVDQDDWI